LGAYLDKALADFSGYLAIDEVYDGPFCVLSVVDKRRYNRLAFQVLDHDPTHEDVRAFLTEFKGQLDKRGLEVRGLTTDGSSLYPKILEELWPDVPHQLCEFHVLKEITKVTVHGLKACVFQGFRDAIRRRKGIFERMGSSIRWKKRASDP
jgi:hypothetical protein